MSTAPPLPRFDGETREALRLLARGLAGAIDVAGFEELPRVDLAAVTGVPLQAAPSTSTKVPVPPATVASAGAAPTTHSPAHPHTAPSVSPDAPTHGRRPRAAVAAGPAAAAAPPVMAAPTRPTPRPGSEAETLELVRDPHLPRPERLRILCDDVIGACTRCKLHRGRNKLVFGVGNPQAAVVFVGEGPGADEDRTGIPFVGAAGQLLTRMIEAMGLRREDVYICNVVKCRPPNNRDPEPDEVEACESFLKEQLAVIQPKVVVGLGRHACHTLLRTQAPISKLRGHWHRYDGVDFMPTYHPSYLLREDRDPTKARKRETWSDLKQVMVRLGLGG